MTVSVAHVARDYVRVTGPEALSYVHSQISQRVDDLAVGEARWSFVLEPQGRTDGFFRVTRLAAEELLLDCDAGTGEHVAESIARFKLRSKAEFVAMSGSMIEVRGEGAAAAAEPVADDAVAVVPSPWEGSGEAVDVLMPGDLGALPATIDHVESSALRVRHGLPGWSAEIDDAIPNETGLIDLSVSFDKGCYRGQELVERVDARRGPRKELQRIAAAVDGRLAVGASITDGERIVGSITSVAGDAGLAYLRADVADDAELRTDGVAVTARPLFG